MTPNPDNGERIAKVIARAGVASRRDAEAMIASGRVKVNGRKIDSPALNVTSRDKITVDGTPLAAPEPARLWLYHKPVGLVTSARDEKGRATVFDSLPEGVPRLMPIGRLDIASEGLLLLTNDGELKRRLELPSTGWLRKYRVRVKGAPDEAALQPLRDGITVEGERFQPMGVTLDRQQGANAWLTVGLREGRNREIRRAMEHVNLVVNRLIRVSYGPFQLGNLAAGGLQEVKPRVLRDQLGLGGVDDTDAAPAPGGAGKPPRSRIARPNPAKGAAVRQGDAMRRSNALDGGKSGGPKKDAKTAPGRGFKGAGGISRPRSPRPGGAGPRRPD